MTAHQGEWFVTATGRQFWPMDPDPADVCLTDIAVALSRICRFGGHLKIGVNPYSVAQHSVHVAELVAYPLQMHALLHDAAEAYVGDMVRPLKRSMPDYQKVEACVAQAVYEHFGLPDLKMDQWDEIKRADNLALATERRDLIAPHPWKWRIDETVIVEGRRTIVPLHPDAACQAFLEKFQELDDMLEAAARG